MKLYSIQDSKANCFLSIFACENDLVACRLVQGSAEGGQLAQFPSDYTIFMIGEWDTESGVITPCVPVSYVRSVFELLKKE